MTVKVLTMIKESYRKLTFGHRNSHTPEAANDVHHCQEFGQLHVMTKKIAKHSN